MNHMTNQSNNNNQKEEGKKELDPEIAQDDRYKNLDPRVRK